jgi:multiple sugar transport system substrate-binding protein
MLSGAAMGGMAVLAACGTMGTSGVGGSANGAGATGSGASDAAMARTITYLHFFGPNDPQTISFPHVLELFQQKYRKANVEPTSTSGGGPTVMEKYQSMIAAGTPPDVAAVNPQYVEPLRARGALADLTPYVKRDGKTFQPDDFNEATLLRAVREGKWHALPLQMGLWFLFYNGNTLTQSGVAPPDASWTWDKLLEAAKQARQRDPNSLGMTMPPYELPVRDNGGDILSADEKKCLLDQPAAVEAIQWNGDLRQKHSAVPHPDETGGQPVRALFDGGRYAFHIGDPGFLSGTLRGTLGFKWDIALVPKGKVTRVTTVKGPSLVMSAGSKQQDAAWAWLAHYNGTEMQRYVATNGKVISARKSALKAFVDLPEGYNKQVIQESAKIARPMPYVARYDEIDKEISTGLNAVYNGQRAAKEAMADVVQKVNLLLAGS